MKRFINTCAAIVYALLCSCSGGDGPAIEVSNARSPAMPPGSSVVAVYADILANRADTLRSISTSIAERADMHATLEEQGMMQMRPLAAIPIAAGEQVRFEPGGNHIMLSGLRQVLPAGTQFPLTLHFAVAGDVAISVQVVAPGAAP